MVHINDPKFLDHIFTARGRRRDKSEFFCNGFPTFKNVVAFATQSVDLHRSRRAPLNAFFSKKSIRRIEPIIQAATTKVLQRLEQHGCTGQPTPMRLLFTALNNDIITEYSFGSSWNSLDHEDLNEDFFEAFHNLTKTFHLNCYHPWLFRFLMLLPAPLLATLIPSMRLTRPYFAILQRQIEEIQKTSRSIEQPPTVIRELLDSDLPESEKTVDRMRIEGQHLLAGGTDSSSNTLTAISYHLLANPDKLKKLKIELLTAVPDINDVPTCAQLEALPYLRAIIHEVLRLHPPPTFCMERVAPEEDLAYTTDSGNVYVIPKGTVIGVSLPLLGRNEDHYPSPLKFDPEKFIQNPELESYQMPFGRGTRRCLGENLATSELYLVIATIFRKYDIYNGTGTQKIPTLELYETTREDVDMVSNFVLPFIAKGRKGVRVVVRN